MKPTNTIHNWSTTTIPADPYKAPEQITQHLQGKISEDKRIITSAVVGQHQGMIRTKSGSLYALGEIDPDYDYAFPMAKQRLLNVLPEVQ
tara:strand:- start:4292 stop:4561 length:270 start_codon:yes stop_codon:yes gene_type:complete